MSDAPNPQPAQQPAPAPQLSGVVQDANAVTRLRSLPALFGIMGPAKIGKTTSVLYSMPGATFFGPRGSFRPALTVTQYVPTIDDVEDLTSLRAKIKTVPRGRDLVLDDVTLMIRRTEQALVKENKDPRKAYGKLKHEVINTFLEIRDTGRNCVVIMHSDDPEMARGKAGTEEYQPASDGQIAISGSSAGEVVKLLDSLVLADRNPVYSMMHPLAYVTGPAAGNYEGLADRYDVVVGRQPGNIGEVLRMAGYTVARHPGLEWQERWIEDAVQRLEQGAPEYGPDSVYNHWAKAAFAQRADPNSIIYMVRDIEARFHLRRSKKLRTGANLLQSWGITLT